MQDWIGRVITPVSRGPADMSLAPATPPRVTSSRSHICSSTPARTHIPFVLLIREQRSRASGSQADICCCHRNTGQKGLLLSSDKLH